DGARGILFNITGGPDLSLFEVNEAAALIKESAHPEVNMIFGAQIDESMGDEVRITVIATGFEQSRVARKMEQPVYRPIARPASQQSNQPQTAQPAQPAPTQPSSQEPARPSTQSPARQQSDFSARVYDEDIEIPTFLRK